IPRWQRVSTCGTGRSSTPALPNRSTSGRCPWRSALAEALKRTPLYAVHVKAGARMVPFGGWEMPVQYGGIVEEHRTVRGAVGLFDVSHMGEFQIAGPGAFP